MQKTAPFVVNPHLKIPGIKISPDNTESKYFSQGTQTDNPLSAHGSPASNSRSPTRERLSLSGVPWIEDKGVVRKLSLGDRSFQKSRNDDEGKTPTSTLSFHNPNTVTFVSEEELVIKMLIGGIATFSPELVRVTDKSELENGQITLINHAGISHIYYRKNDGEIIELTLGDVTGLIVFGDDEIISKGVLFNRIEISSNEALEKFLHAVNFKLYQSAQLNKGISDSARLLECSLDNVILRVLHSEHSVVYANGDLIYIVHKGDEINVRRININNPSLEYYPFQISGANCSLQSVVASDIAQSMKENGFCNLPSISEEISILARQIKQLLDKAFAIDDIIEEIIKRLVLGLNFGLNNYSQAEGIEHLPQIGLTIFLKLLDIVKKQDKKELMHSCGIIKRLLDSWCTMPHNVNLALYNKIKEYELLTRFTVAHRLNTISLDGNKVYPELHVGRNLVITGKNSTGSFAERVGDFDFIQAVETNYRVPQHVLVLAVDDLLEQCATEDGDEIVRLQLRIIRVMIRHEPTIAEAVFCSVKDRFLQIGKTFIEVYKEYLFEPRVLDNNKHDAMLIISKNEEKFREIKTIAALQKYIADRDPQYPGEHHLFSIRDNDNGEMRGDKLIETFRASLASTNPPLTFYDFLMQKLTTYDGLVRPFEFKVTRMLIATCESWAFDRSKLMLMAYVKGNIEKIKGCFVVGVRGIFNKLLELNDDATRATYLKKLSPQFFSDSELMEWRRGEISRKNLMDTVTESALSPENKGRIGIGLVTAEEGFNVDFLRSESVQVNNLPIKVLVSKFETKDSLGKSCLTIVADLSLTETIHILLVQQAYRIDVVNLILGSILTMGLCVKVSGGKADYLVQESKETDKEICVNYTFTSIDRDNASSILKVDGVLFFDKERLKSIRNEFSTSYDMCLVKVEITRMRIQNPIDKKKLDMGYPDYYCSITNEFQFKPDEFVLNLSSL